MKYVYDFVTYVSFLNAEVHETVLQWNTFGPTGTNRS